MKAGATNVGGGGQAVRKIMGRTISSKRDSWVKKPNSSSTHQTSAAKSSFANW
jgi:hypothetical protein